MFAKILITIKVLFYLCHRMIYYAFLKIEESERKGWLREEVQNWAAYCLKLLKIDLRVEGPEGGYELPEKKAVFFISNHQSYTDIPTLYVVMGKLFGFVAKIELGRIPFLNYWMKQMGCIFIDRKKFTNAIRTIKRKEKEGSLNPLVVFPEGTRAKNDQINAFKPGVLKLAWSLKAQIQPVVIRGTRASWEKRGKAPFTVYAKILDPIEWTEEFLKDFDLFEAELHKQMVAAYQELGSK